MTPPDAPGVDRGPTPETDFHSFAFRCVSGVHARLVTTCHLASGSGTAFGAWSPLDCNDCGYALPQSLPAKSPLNKASLVALCSNVDALAEHNMEALRAELALDSAFAAASPQHPDVQHAPDTDTDAERSSMDVAAPQRSSADLE